MKYQPSLWERLKIWKIKILPVWHLMVNLLYIGFDNSSHYFPIFCSFGCYFIQQSLNCFMTSFQPHLADTLQDCNFLDSTCTIQYILQKCLSLIYWRPHLAQSVSWFKLFNLCYTTIYVAGIFITSIFAKKMSNWIYWKKKGCEAGKIGWIRRIFPIFGSNYKRCQRKGYNLGKEWKKDLLLVSWGKALKLLSL